MNTKNKPVKYGRLTLIFIVAVTVLGGATFYLRPLTVLSWATGIQLRLNGFESKYVQTGSYKMHYWIGGEGKPLLLIHGGGQKGEQFFNQMPNLSRHYRVYAIDMLGHGESDKPLNVDYSLEFQAQHIEKFIRSQNISKTTILAYCLGGNVALTYASLWPDTVEKMILTGGPFIYDPKLYPWDFGNQNDLEDVRKLIKAGNYPYMPDFVLIDLLRDINKQKQIFKSITKSILPEIISWDNRKFNKISMPVLLIWGKQDTMFPVIVGFRAQRKLPNSVMLSFDGCKHLELGDLCEYRVLPEIEKFLSGQSYPAGSMIEIPAPKQ